MKFIHNNKVEQYILTAVITFVTLLVMVFTLGIYPFGDKAYLWADADQYFGITHYLGTITTKNDMFYTWTAVLGGNALAELAYYAFSPLNVFYIIFSNHMMLAAHVVTYIKIVLVALSFFYCADYLHKDMEYHVKAALSISYSFMGYMVFFGWNSSWMDGVMLLPWIYIGLIRLVNEKKYGMYTIALSLSIISNFYIGFMLCITSVILYLLILSIDQQGFFKTAKSSFVGYALSSIIGGGMSAFVLIPTYLALPKTRQVSIMEILQNMTSNISLSAILSGLFTGQSNSMDSNAPLIYVGMFPLALIIIYFTFAKGQAKKKACYAIVAIFLIISFINSFINIIWHGLSLNAWFNYRYSFVFSFVLMLIALEGYDTVRKGGFTQIDFIKGSLVLVLLALIVRLGSDKVSLRTMAIDLLSVGFILLVVALGKANKKWFAGIVVLVVIVNSIGNGFLYLKDVTMNSRKNYGDNQSLMLQAETIINDASFYRMDKTFSLGHCDAALFDYRGVSNYASTENLENMEYLKKLGLAHGWVSAIYTQHLPESTECLLGLKYIITDALNDKDYSHIGDVASYGIYKNDNALPILFPVEELSNVDLDKVNNFELQNANWSSINKLENDVFLPNTLEEHTSENEIILTATVNNSGAVFISIPEAELSSVDVRGTNLESKIYYSPVNELYYVGEFDKGDTFDLVFSKDEVDGNLDNIFCYTEDKAAIKANVDKIDDFDFTIKEVSSSHLNMIYTGDRKIISTSIPYDKGWKVYDNGKKVQIKKNMNNFISFELGNRTAHDIKLVYRPVGFIPGAVISLCALVILVIYFVINKKKRYKNNSYEK